ncbi:MAG: hypothetical protein HWD61_09350 [Parachlamydiaceae bacterium]|nr:MAG: hypothetical protein HWD61_09350 [Parachlamydiaceae bacterium]
MIIAGLRNPQDVMKNEEKLLVYLTYSHTVPSLKALFETLEKQEYPQGVLPFRKFKFSVLQKQKFQKI